MVNDMDFSDKKILICGMARSGIAAANLLLEEGAVVSISDSKPMDALAEAIAQVSERARIIAGKISDEEVLSHDMLVLSPGVPTNLKYIQKAQAAGIPVIGEFELASRFCKAPIIAITGTNGKTTTTAMLYDIMKAYNPLSEMVGNVGIAFSERAKRIDPEAICVAEVSSFQLETIETFKPKVSAILNFALDHLDRHGTFENYVNIKAKIFENQDESDYLVLNYDNEDCRKLAARAKASVLWFSYENYDIEGIFLKDDAIYLNLNGEIKHILDTCDMIIVGKHNYENAMAAILMSHIIGAPMDLIVENIKRFGGVSHRMEYVCTKNGVAYYNDSKATNPESAIKAIEAIDKPIRLIGGGRGKDSDFNLWIKSFAHKVRKLYIIGEVVEILEQTCRAHGFYDYKKFDSFEEAVKAAIKDSEAGEAVLLSPACASLDMFRDYEERGNLFKKIVNEA